MSKFHTYTFNCVVCGEETTRTTRTDRRKSRTCSYHCSSVLSHRNRYHFWTEPMNEIIRAEYTKTPNHTIAIDRILEYPAFSGLNRNRIVRQAVRLGMSKAVYFWTKSEIDLLFKLNGERSVEAIMGALKRRGFHRTKAAIFVKMQRLGLSRIIDIYSAKDVADALGCSERTAVSNIFKKGLIKFKQNGKRGPWNGFYVKPRDLAIFIRQYPYEANKYNPDIPFLVALLDEYRPTKVAWDEKEKEFLTGQ